MHTSVNNAYRTMYGSIDVSTRSWLPGILASPLSSWLQQHTSKFVIRLTQDLWYIFFFNYGTSHMYSTSLIFISCQQQNQKFNLNFLLDPNCGLIKITLYTTPPPPFLWNKEVMQSCPVTSLYFRVWEGSTFF